MQIDSDLFNKTLFQNETFLNTKRPTYSILQQFVGKQFVK